MEKLQKLFVSKEAMQEFQQLYIQVYKGNLSLDDFDWDEMAYQITEQMDANGQSELPYGEYELACFETKSNNPEVLKFERGHLSLDINDYNLFTDAVYDNRQHYDGNEYYASVVEKEGKYYLAYFLVIDPENDDGSHVCDFETITYLEKI